MLLLIIYKKNKRVSESETGYTSRALSTNTINLSSLGIFTEVVFLVTWTILESGTGHDLSLRSHGNAWNLRFRTLYFSVSLNPTKTYC